ncbi:hypothetical protein CJD36_019480 [Flavipsychrobacter stenotrophus]|uniref:Lipoprotein n=1 Tax=Flavipsychrobacter stenotrophus TaxID=2077091 RepID=A0A2S7SS98_9BACT|nr:hypothetical protein CJD36_019480 [Flavipsychrobacter stenotrophus]
MRNILSLILLFTLSCVTHKKPHRVVFKPINSHIILGKETKYLNDTFLYEPQIVLSYVEIDAITKDRCFIRRKNTIEQSYDEGVYFIDGYLLKTFINNGNEIDSSLKKLYATLIDDDYEFNGKEYSTAYYGLKYRQYCMSVKVIFIDSILQKIPLFLDSQQYYNFSKKHHGINYSYKKLPSYLIVEGTIN